MASDLSVDRAPAFQRAVSPTRASAHGRCGLIGLGRDDQEADPAAPGVQINLERVAAGRGARPAPPRPTGPGRAGPGRCGSRPGRPPPRPAAAPTPARRPARPARPVGRDPLQHGASASRSVPGGQQLARRVLQQHRPGPRGRLAARPGGPAAARAGPPACPRCPHGPRDLLPRGLRSQPCAARKIPAGPRLNPAGQRGTAGRGRGRPGPRRAAGRAGQRPGTAG